MMTDTQAIAATQMFFTYLSFAFMIVSVCAWLGARRLKKKCAAAIEWCEFIKTQVEEEHDACVNVQMECIRARQLAMINKKLCELNLTMIQSEAKKLKTLIGDAEANIENKISGLNADMDSFNNPYRSEWSEAGEPVG